MSYGVRGSLPSIGLGLLVLLGSGSAVAVAQTPAPGVRRIAVGTSGNAAEGISNGLIELLRGDGTVIDVVALTNRLAAPRLAEARNKQCDFVLEATFDARPKTQGGMLSRATDLARTLNGETGTVGTTAAQRAATDNKVGSVDRLAKSLTPDAKDKVHVTYRLLSTTSAVPLLTNDKDVAAAELPAFLEKLLNDVVASVLK